MKRKALVITMMIFSFVLLLSSCDSTNKPEEYATLPENERTYGSETTHPDEMTQLIYRFPHLDFNARAIEIRERHRNSPTLEELRDERGIVPVRRTGSIGRQESLSYITSKQSGNLNFFFQEDNYALNALFVNQTEALIHEISNLIPTHNHRLRLFQVEHTELLGIGAFRELALSHDDTQDFGLLTLLLHQQNQTVLFYTSMTSPRNANLPFWLLNGIEAVARQNAGLGSYTGLNTDNTSFIYDEAIFDEMGFGDIHFLPVFRGSDEHKRAVNTAYSFTLYLIENGYFDRLVELYTSGARGDRQHANSLAVDLFYSFSGRILDPSFTLTFGTGAIGSGSHMLTYHAELSDVNFFIGNHSNHRLGMVDFLRHARGFEEATAFVKEWYLQFFEWEYERINHNVRSLSFSNAGSANTNLAIYNGLSRDTRNWVAAHEVVHILDIQVRGSSGFPPFREGLAMYKMWLHYEGSRIDVMEHFSNPGRITFADEHQPFNSSMPEYNRRINSYVLAGAFVEFLIETYGPEKYFQVHWRHRNFENVYGATVNEMIDRRFKELEGR